MLAPFAVTGYTYMLYDIMPLLWLHLPHASWSVTHSTDVRDSQISNIFRRRSAMVATILFHA